MEGIKKGGSFEPRFQFDFYIATFKEVRIVARYPQFKVFKFFIAPFNFIYAT